MFFFLKPLRLFAKALVVDATPQQMALGCALGVAIGLVPKGNLIAITLMVILGALRVNLGVGVLTAFCVSWLGIFVDPFSHQIGEEVLTHDALQATWTELYNLPFVPWTRFNNTVVMGSTVLGLALLLPIYWATLPIFAKYTPKWGEKLSHYKVVHVLQSAELTGKLN